MWNKISKMNFRISVVEIANETNKIYCGLNELPMFYCGLNELHLFY